MSKPINQLPLALQQLFAQLRSEQAVDAVDGTQTKATSEDIMDEFVRIDTEVDADPIDEDDEEQIDMTAVSPAMLAVFQ